MNSNLKLNIQERLVLAIFQSNLTLITNKLGENLLNAVVMRKIVIALVILASIVAMSSCDYDDSNDIDVLSPNDSTETGVILTK